MADHELDFSHLIAGEVVDRIAGHVSGIDAANLIYEQPGFARALKWTAAEVSDQLDDLLAIIGSPIVMAQGWLREAAALAETNTLSFYDASWAATARALQVPLMSADRRLLGAGLAEAPSAVTSRLNLASQ